MTPAEGVKRAAQALSLLWPFAVIAAVMSLLLAAGLPLFAFQAIFTLRKGIRGASLPALLISVIGTAVCGLGLLLSEASLAFWYPVFVNLALLLAFAASLFGTPVAEAVARKLSKEPLPDAGIRYCLVHLLYRERRRRRGHRAFRKPRRVASLEWMPELRSDRAHDGD